MTHRTISRDHVVDRRHVNGVIGDTDETGEDHRRDPVRLVGAKRGPREANQTYRQERAHYAVSMDTGVAQR